MRRQRFSHTLCPQDDGSQPNDLNPEDEQMVPYDTSYYMAQYVTVQTEQPLQWNNYSSGYDAQEQYPPQPIQHSLSSTSSFYNSYNSFAETTCYQDVYGESQSYVQPASQVDDYNGATGDAVDFDAVANHENDFEHSQDPDGSQYDAGLYESPPLTITFPNISSIGTIYLVLRHCIRVDITSDKAIFVSNYPGNCIGVINDAGDHSCIIHPNGKVLQELNTVHMETGNKLAKFCRRGVVFTSREHSLSYVVDPSGTKSTSDRFKDLSTNFALNLFFGTNPSRLLEQQSLSTCHNLISEALYRKYNNGDEIWFIGGIRIKQNLWGELKISGNSGRKMLKTSPTINSISVSTPYAFMKISCHPFRHFVVRRGDRSFSAGTTGVAIQNGSQKAGFDRSGRLVLH